MMRTLLSSLLLATVFASAETTANLLAKADAVQSALEGKRMVEAYRLGNELQTSISMDLKHPRIASDFERIADLGVALEAVRAAIREDNLLKALERNRGLVQALYKAAHDLPPAERLRQLEADLTQLHGIWRESHLGEVGYAALDAGDLLKATVYGRELVEAGMAGSKSLPRGDAVFDGNQILGLVAIRQWDVTEAKARLAAAGATTGSPVLGSFGPTFLLAEELLKKGEREAVLAFLEACGKFWKMDRGKLAEWSTSIRSGGTPNLSRF